MIGTMLRPKLTRCSVGRKRTKRCRRFIEYGYHAMRLKGAIESCTNLVIRRSICHPYRTASDNATWWCSAMRRSEQGNGVVIANLVNLDRRTFNCVTMSVPRSPDRRLDHDNLEQSRRSRTDKTFTCNHSA